MDGIVYDSSIVFIDIKLSVLRISVSVMASVPALDSSKILCARYGINCKGVTTHLQQHYLITGRRIQ